MTGMGRFVLAAFVIFVATLWGATQYANAIFTSPGSGSRGMVTLRVDAGSWHRTRPNTHKKHYH